MGSFFIVYMKSCTTHAVYDTQGAKAPKLCIVSKEEKKMEKKNGMRIEIGKLVDGAWLTHAGVKGTPVPADAMIEANNINLAMLAMVNGEGFTLCVKPVVTLVNYPQGTKNYFPTVKFVAPAGTKIGNVFIADTEKVFELEHYRVNGHKSEVRPSALRESEIVKGALKALETKLFPKSDLTDLPIPETDYCSLLVKEFGWNEEKLEHAAEMIQKYGMTWRAYYLAAKAKK